MTTNDLISHLTALVAADPSVGDLSVHLYGPYHGEYPLEGSLQPITASPALINHLPRRLSLGGSDSYNL